jgi:hypothetical protein
MKSATTILAVFLLPLSACGDNFGSGQSEFTMDFVNITGRNVADDTGYGAVAYDYRMGVYEVSRPEKAIY